MVMAPLTGEYRFSSESVTNSSSDVGRAERDWWRSQRTVSGASTEKRMKKGRRERASRTASDGIDVMTQRDRHDFVTKSKRAFTSPNVWAGCEVLG